MVDDSVVDELERSVAAVLRLLADRTTTSDVAKRCGYELPPASWALLEHLDAHGALRVSDIAACHGVDVSSITPRLKRLEGAGLVNRSRAPSDARASLISITPVGAHALESVHAARREILRDALGDTDPERVAGATDVLRRIAGQLSRDPLATAAR
jgi:DNA-binding MarR family transcriptional regulator